MFPLKFLFSSTIGTKKCLEAEKKGLVVVTEEWVSDQIDGNKKVSSKKSKTTSSSTTTTTKAKATKAATTPEVNNAEGQSLNGLVFAISGKLSIPRKEFEEFIISNGGQVSKTVTNRVTHLVT